MQNNCIVCGSQLGYRQRKYCSKKCKNKYYNAKYKDYIYRWNEIKRGEYADNKIQCLICGRWYVQVGTHVWYKHKMTARQYREMYKLEVKKGIVPKWYRELKGNQALKNETYKNLKAGKKYWFKKGQKDLGKYERSEITMERLRNLHKIKLEKS